MIPSLEGWPTKAKEAPSSHEVRMTPLDTNPVSLGGKLEGKSTLEGNKFSSELSGIYMVPWCWKYALKKVRMVLITYEVESHLVDESGDIVDIEEKIIIEALQKASSW